MDTSSDHGSDGTDELLTSLDPLLNQSNQLVLESAREEKSFTSSARSYSSFNDDIPVHTRKFTDDIPVHTRKFTDDVPAHIRKFTDDAPVHTRKFTDDAPVHARKFIDDAPVQTRKHKRASSPPLPEFDPRHASASEILERTERQLKALNGDHLRPEPRSRNSEGPARPSPANVFTDSYRPASESLHRLSEGDSEAKKSYTTAALRYKPPTPSHNFSFDSERRKPTPNFSLGNEDASESRARQTPNLSLNLGTDDSRRPKRFTPSVSLAAEDSRPKFTPNMSFTGGHDNPSSLLHKTPALNTSQSVNQQPFLHKENTPTPPRDSPRLRRQIEVLSRECDDAGRELKAAEAKMVEMRAEAAELRETVGRKDQLLQHLDKSLASVVGKWKGREMEKDEAIAALRQQLAAVEAEVRTLRNDNYKLENTVAQARVERREREETTEKAIEKSKEKMTREAEEARRMRRELDERERQNAEMKQSLKIQKEELFNVEARLRVLETDLNEERLNAKVSAKEKKELQDQHALELQRATEKMQQMEVVVLDLRKAMDTAQQEIERSHLREQRVREEKRALASELEAKEVEVKVALRRLEADLKARQEQERAKLVSAMESAKTQSEQSLRTSLREEIHTLTARHKKELAQLRERADSELARLQQEKEEALSEARREVASLHERNDLLRRQKCDAEAQRLQTLSQMQYLMQANCAEALSLLRHSSTNGEAAPPPSLPPPPPPPDSERPQLEAGDNFDIIDSLVVPSSRASEGRINGNGSEVGDAGRMADLMSFTPRVDSEETDFAKYLIPMRPGSRASSAAGPLP